MGVYQFAPNKSRRFALAMDYDTIHNITTKSQSDVVVEPSGSTVPQKKTSYAWTYAYGGPRPHAATHLGERTFTYDANGNQAGFTHDRNGTRRTIVWDEENRIQSLAENGHTETYKYDDDGERVIKRGPQGETVYVNSFFTIRNREVGTKHVFAGETRLVSKLVKSGTVYEKDLYFYHPDHVGSSSYVTDADAKLYEHIEYFPFGESWIEEASNIQRTPYRFTAKELDEETALTYFGARYYDPRTSVWQSPDPQLAKYLPTRGDTDARSLPGQGGVFDPLNLGLYGYAGLNPIKLKDQDGLDKATVEKIAKAISAEMDKAWTASFNADGTTKEQGSAIVLAGGVFKAKSASKQSTSGNVAINTDVDAGEKLAGTFHTHPFGTSEGGHLGVAHSLDDIDAIGKGTKGRFTFIEAGSKRYALEIVDLPKFKAFAASTASVDAYYKGEGSVKGDLPTRRLAGIKALANAKDSGLKLYQSVDKAKVKFEEVK
jgi:RHS repeat-associated protein